MKKEKSSSRLSENSEEGKLKKESRCQRQPEDQGKKEKGKQGRKEKPGIKILVPLLSKKEAMPLFIEAVAEMGKQIILLLVIDTPSMVGQFGFATSEIATGNALMEEVKTAFGKKRKQCLDVIEWGDTATKIGHLALLHRVEKICIVKQNNQFYENLLKQLKENLKETQIEEIALPAAA